MENAFSQTLYAEALSWVGTPFRHNRQVKGVGADCLGFVLGAFQNVGVDIDWPITTYAQNWYREDKGEQFFEALSSCMSGYSGGDYAVSLFCLRRGIPANHVGLWFRGEGQGWLIHAHSRHGVIRNHYSTSWARREVTKFTKEK